MFILLFLLYASSIVASQLDSFDLFDSFAVNTNKVYNVNLSKYQDTFEVVTELAAYSDGIIIKASDPITLIKIDPQGVEVTRTQIGGYEDNWEGNRIYWDSNNFVVPVAGGIQQYNNSDLSLNTSFGTDGTASFATVTINNRSYSVQFDSVKKSGNYYYALGYYNTSDQYETIRPIVVRFTLAGKIDLTFNASGTPGYAAIPTSEPVYQMDEILILKDYIVIKTYNSYIVSVPLNGPFNTYNVVSGVNNACNMVAASDNNSFFIYGNNTLYKYTGDLQPDLSFNDTGSVLFDNASTLFPNDNLVFALTRVGTRILIGGQYSDNNNYQFPFILCYDISNTAKPILDTSFFGKGYLLPNKSLYPNSAHGIFKIVVTSTSVPSLFFSSAHYITQVLLEEVFSRTTVIAKTIAATIVFEEAKGNKIPFLAGMFH